MCVLARGALWRLKERAAAGAEHRDALRTEDKYYRAAQPEVVAARELVDGLHFRVGTAGLQLKKQNKTKRLQLRAYTANQKPDTCPLLTSSQRYKCSVVEI